MAATQMMRVMVDALPPGGVGEREVVLVVTGPKRSLPTTRRI